VIFIIKKRIIAFLPTFLGVTLLSFALIRLAPGDPVLLMVGERGASPEVYAQMQSQLGLDQPLLIQYYQFILGLLQGDFGTSITSQQSVLSEFSARFSATLELGIVSMVWALLLGLPIGVIAAAKQKSWLDQILMSGSLIGYSMPIFWWGLLLILFFSVHLGWTPVSGRMSFEFDVPDWTGVMLIDVWRSEQPWQALKSGLHHLILPSIVLGTIPLAVVARMTRSSLLEVLREDYIRTARAKGVREYSVLMKHALKNAAIPIITVIGLMMGTLLTGAILTETIFSWPGIGRWIVASVESRDYPVIQGGIVLIALLIFVINLIVDLAYVWVNPNLNENEST